MSQGWPSAIDEAARRQFGLVRWDDMVAAVGWSAARTEVRAARLVRVEWGVYRFVGSAPSFRQRVLAACLSYGPPVAASHTSAARLWGIEAVAAAGIELTVPHGRSGRRRTARTHRVDLDPGDLTEHHGIPVTTPARTLCDLAPRLSADVLALAVDDVMRRRLARPSELAAGAEGVARRPGASAFRSLVAARLGGPGAGDSAWVATIVRWLTDAGLPPPAVEHPVVVAGRPRFLDVAYPPEKVAVEFNGWEHHQTRSRADADHARTSELELDGWIVLVVTAAHGRERVVAWVRRALEERAGGPRQRASWGA